MITPDKEGCKPSPEGFLHNFYFKKRTDNRLSAFSIVFLYFSFFFSPSRASSIWQSRSQA